MGPVPGADVYATTEGAHPGPAESFTVMKAAPGGAVILEKVERIDALALRPSPKGGPAFFHRTHGSGGFEWKLLVPGEAARVAGRETSP
jgi:hypothetical protein